jgi:hypothetical protein
MINSWLETLTDYDFEVIHKPGIKNILPDRLSRLYPEEETNDKKEIRIWAMNGNNWSIETPIPIETFQGLTAGTIDSEETRKILMKRAHEEGHFGAQAMHKKLLVAGHKWPRMLEDLQNLVKACITCQRFNIRAHGFHPMTSVDADLPFDHVAIDLKEMERSEKGNHYILVLVDICTRFTIVRALKDKSMYSVAKSLLSLFSLVGFPKILQSDNGTEFVNNVVKSLTEIMTVEHRLINSIQPPS